MMPLASKLESIQPFSELPQPILQHVVDASRQRQYQAGDFIALYGETWPFLFLVESGRFQALKESQAGRSLVVLSLGPDDVFWGLSFFRETVPMPVSLRAETDGALVIWQREKLLPLLLREGKALWSLCGLLVERMQRASAIVEDLAFQPLAGRLAKLLLEEYGGHRQEPVLRDLTLEEMAARVGTTREMVCRVLYQLSDEGLIEITRTEFTLMEIERLEKMAGLSSQT